MLCSGGIQSLSSGRSGVVVLGTNAQTWIIESFHPWALESLNAWILESLNARILESLSPGGFESLTLWILGSGCGNLFFCVGRLRNIFRYSRPRFSWGWHCFQHWIREVRGGERSRTPKTRLSFYLVTCKILSVNSKTLSENRYWEGVGFWIQAAVNTRSTHSQHTVYTQAKLVNIEKLRIKKWPSHGQFS